MSEHIHKAHNVSALLYHLVCPTEYRRAVITEYRRAVITEYRRAVITDEVDAALRSVCLDIGNRYEKE